MNDPRRFKTPEDRQKFGEALLRLAADDIAYIAFTVEKRPVMIVSDDLNRKMGEVVAAITAGVHVVTYSEYLAAMSEAH